MPTIQPWDNSPLRQKSGTMQSVQSSVVGVIFAVDGPLELVPKTRTSLRSIMGSTMKAF